MNKTFCPHCGSKIEYGVDKPKFCPSCGKELNAFSSASKKTSDEESESKIYIPSADELEFEIIGEKRVRFTDVANQKQGHYPSSTNDVQRN